MHMLFLTIHHNAPESVVAFHLYSLYSEHNNPVYWQLLSLEYAYSICNWALLTYSKEAAKKGDDVFALDRGF